MMIKGETALEVEGVYTQAYELSQQVGDRQQLFSALMSLSRLYLNRARIQKARELAEQCFNLSHSMQDPVLLQAVHQRLGSTLFFHGDIVLARMHFEQGHTLYMPNKTTCVLSVAVCTPACLVSPIWPGHFGCLDIQIKPCIGAGGPYPGPGVVLCL